MKRFWYWAQPRTRKAFKGRNLAYRQDTDFAKPQYTLLFRTCDSDTATFTSQDPIQDDHNPYRYVGNNPINRDDSSGLQDPARHHRIGSATPDLSSDYGGYKDFFGSPGSGFLQGNELRRVYGLPPVVGRGNVNDTFIGAPPADELAAREAFYNRYPRAEWFYDNAAAGATFNGPEVDELNALIHQMLTDQHRDNYLAQGHSATRYEIDKAVAGQNDILNGFLKAAFAAKAGSSPRSRAPNRIGATQKAPLNPSPTPKGLLSGNVIVKDTKWDYFFGRVTSNPHNQARSLQNLKDLKTLGFEDNAAGRLGLTKLFEIGRHSAEISRHTTQFGVTITRRVPAGDKGIIEVKYFYPGGNMSAIPEVSTIIPKVFQ